MNKFFTSNIEEKFIKNMIYNTPLPIYQSVKDGDYLVKDINYLYGSNIIRCTKNGILNFDVNYDIPWEKIYPLFTLYTEYNSGTYFSYDYPILSTKDSVGGIGTIFRFNNTYKFLQTSIIFKVQKLIYENEKLIQTIDLEEESADDSKYYKITINNKKIVAISLKSDYYLKENEYIKIFYNKINDLKIYPNEFKINENSHILINVSSEDEVNYPAFPFLNENNIYSIYIINDSISNEVEDFSITDTELDINTIGISIDNLDYVLINYIDNQEKTLNYYEVLQNITDSNNLDVYQLLEQNMIRKTIEYEIEKADYEIVKKNIYFGDYNQQYTYRPISKNNYYDSKAHRFLGEYLRCYKNIWGTNLMPFYNCFNEEYLKDFYIENQETINSYYTINQLIRSGNFKTPGVWQGINGTGGINGGILTYTVTTKKNDGYSNRIVNNFSPIEWIYKHKYYICISVKSNVNGAKIYATKTATSNGVNGTCELSDTWYKFENIFTLNDSADLSYKLWLRYYNPQSIGDSIQFKNCMLIDLTQNFGYGKEPTLSEFKNLFPNDYYEYNVKFNAINYNDITYNLSLVKFTNNSITDNYKVLKIPVKLNRKYTIALDCQGEVRLGCAFIQNNDLLTVKFNNEQFNLTDEYNQYNKSNIQIYYDTSYSVPILYETINRSTKFLNKDELQLSTLLQMYEEYFYLLIQVPKDNKSSVVVLEGDYTDLKNRKYMNIESIDSIPENEIDKNCLSGLSLLQFNDKNNYCYSANLIEYLLWNVIDNNDEIEEDISKIQRDYHILTNDSTAYNYPGYWSKSMRPIIYNKYRDNKKSSNIDINGYVDKKIENSK